jgi:hypothetical protein
VWRGLTVRFKSRKRLAMKEPHKKLGVETSKHKKPLPKRFGKGIPVRQSLPDFWGFLQQYIARLNEEARKVKFDMEMEALVGRWLTQADNGVLQKIKSAPFFLAAEPKYQCVFMKTMTDRVHQVKREWQEIHSAFES